MENNYSKCYTINKSYNRRNLHLFLINIRFSQMEFRNRKWNMSKTQYCITTLTYRLLCTEFCSNMASHIHMRHLKLAFLSRSKYKKNVY